MIYIPLRYTVSAKYPVAWFIDQLVFVDMLMPLAATSYDMNTLLVHCICLPFYILSFMCIYEIGYFDNDMRAAKSEASPVLSDSVQRFTRYRLEPYAWIFAVALAGVGGGIAVRAHLFTMDAFRTRSELWIAVLIAVRIAFHIYNRQNENDRPTLYFVLQVLKYGSVLVVFSPTVFGAVITASQILAISAVYWTYRRSGRRNSEGVDREKLRLIIAFGIAVPLALAGVHTPNDSLLAAALAVAWLLLRLAKPKVMSVVRNRHAPPVK
jgi:hypothetical protein